MANPLLSPRDLSEEAVVPVNTVYQWNSKGTGPRYIRVGRHIRYRRADVDAWLDAHAVDPRPAA